MSHDSQRCVPLWWRTSGIAVYKSRQYTNQVEASFVCRLAGGLILDYPSCFRTRGPASDFRR